MKKISKVLLTSTLTTSLLFGGAISADAKSRKEKNKESKKEVKLEKETKNYKVKVDDVQYFSSSSNKMTDNEAIVGLKVTIKNKSKHEMTVSDDDFKLYDEDNSKISDTVFTAPSEDGKEYEELEYLDGLDSKKSTTGYIFYKVKTDKEYTLNFKPDTTYVDDKKVEYKKSTMKIDFAKYKNPNKEIIKDAETFVKSVFFKDEGAKSENLGDTNQLATDYHNKVVQKYKEDAFDTLSDQDISNLVSDFQKANGQKAQLSYKVSELTPSYAEVEITGKVLTFEKFDFEAAGEKFIAANEGKYDSEEDALPDIERFLMDELKKWLSSANPETDIASSTNITFKKENGKWIPDTDDYDYKNLCNEMAGEYLD